MNDTVSKRFYLVVYCVSNVKLQFPQFFCDSENYVFHYNYTIPYFIICVEKCYIYCTPIIIVVSVDNQMCI